MRCEALGVAAYLMKPIRPSEFSRSHWSIARRTQAQYESSPLITRYSLGNVPGTSATFLRILVAEDNVVNQKLIVPFLEKRGHRITVTSNGIEAPRCSRSAKPTISS